MIDLKLALTIIGVLMLVASVAVYWKDSSKAVFPIILAIGGIFMSAAQHVKASVAGVDVELNRTVDTVVQASTDNGDLLLAQQEALKALADDLGKLRESFVAYQEAANQRLAALDAQPVPVPDEAAIAASAERLEATLSAARVATEPVARVNKELKTVVGRNLHLQLER